MRANSGRIRPGQGHGPDRRAAAQGRLRSAVTSRLSPAGGRRPPCLGASLASDPAALSALSVSLGLHDARVLVGAFGDAAVVPVSSSGPLRPRVCHGSSGSGFGESDGRGHGGAVWSSGSALVEIEAGAERTGRGHGHERRRPALLRPRTSPQAAAVVGCQAQVEASRAPTSDEDRFVAWRPSVGAYTQPSADRARGPGRAGPLRACPLIGRSCLPGPPLPNRPRASNGPAISESSPTAPVSSRTGCGAGRAVIA